MLHPHFGGLVMNTALLPLLSLSLLSAQVSDNQCAMKFGFAQRDGKFKLKDGTSRPRHTAVWLDDQNAMLFADSMNVNTDGTLRSYSVDDYWGEKTALNNLCNASSDKCSGMTSDQKRARRLATQKAKADGWPIAAIPALKIDPQIIPFKEDGRPCDEVDGYLVSATALIKPGIDNRCDVNRYIDSQHLQAVVLPRGPRPDPKKPRNKSAFQLRGAEIGDLAVVMSGDGTVLTFAVVGDVGPASELGEGTIALAKTLLRKDALPLNYREVRGDTGQRWIPGKTFTLIFPKSRDAKNPYVDQTRIDADAQKLFEAWGGVARLKDCASIYKAR